MERMSLLGYNRNCIVLKSNGVMNHEKKNRNDL